jgi:hypothetical protein
VLAGALAASSSIASSTPAAPAVSFSGETVPARLPDGRPRPIGLTAGFTSVDPDGGPAPELDRIEIDLSPRVSMRTAKLPLCRERLLFKTNETALEECGGSLVGRGRIASDIPTSAGGPTARVEGEINVFYGLAGPQPMLLGRVETGQPMPLVFVIPFAIERSTKSGYELVAHRMRRRLGKCRAGYPDCFADPYGVQGLYARIAEFEISFGRGGRRSSLFAGSCPIRSVVSNSNFALARVDLDYASGPAVSGNVRGACA